MKRNPGTKRAMARIPNLIPALRHPWAVGHFQDRGSQAVISCAAKAAASKGQPDGDEGGAHCK
jgi:hypothetical protein